MALRVRLSDPNGNGSRFGTDIETDAAPAASGSRISYGVIPLPVQRLAPRQNFRGTGRDTQLAALAKMKGDLDIAAV